MAHEDRPESRISPLQSSWRHGQQKPRAWRAPTTQDFLRQLSRRLAVGPAYAVFPDDWERAEIFVRTLDDDRWTSKWFYPVLGLRAMGEAGLLEVKEETDIPGFDMSDYESRFPPGTVFVIWWLGTSVHESRS